MFMHEVLLQQPCVVAPNFADVINWLETLHPATVIIEVSSRLLICAVWSSIEIIFFFANSHQFSFRLIYCHFHIVVFCDITPCKCVSTVKKKYRSCFTLKMEALRCSETSQTTGCHNKDCQSNVHLHKKCQIRFSPLFSPVTYLAYEVCVIKLFKTL
jgi:hypothetical protein